MLSICTIYSHCALVHDTQVSSTGDYKMISTGRYKSNFKPGRAKMDAHASSAPMNVSEPSVAPDTGAVLARRPQKLYFQSTAESALPVAVSVSSDTLTVEMHAQTDHYRIHRIDLPVVNKRGNYVVRSAALIDTPNGSNLRSNTMIIWAPPDSASNLPYPELFLYLTFNHQPEEIEFTLCDEPLVDFPLHPVRTHLHRVVGETEIRRRV